MPDKAPTAERAVEQGSPERLRHASLIEALVAFQGEDGLTFNKTKTAKVKAKSGAEYEYKYADLGEILPVVRPLLAKHGLAWSSKVERREGDEMVLIYRLLHVNGEIDHGELPLGVAPDSKPQELGSALTYARRYAITTQLNLATQDDDDGKAAQDAPRSAPRQAANTRAPVDPDEEKRADAIRRWSAMKEASPFSAQEFGEWAAARKIGNFKELRGESLDAALAKLDQLEQAEAAAQAKHQEASTAEAPTPGEPDAGEPESR